MRGKTGYEPDGRDQPALPDPAIPFVANRRLFTTLPDAATLSFCHRITVTEREAAAPLSLMAHERYWRRNRRMLS